MIGIVFIGDLKYSPYINLYTKELEKRGFDYEVLFWNRDENEAIEINSKYVPFKHPSKLNKPKISKLKDFIAYRKWLISRINDKNQKYDKLILLSTLSGLIIADKLIKNYKEKYILDIRDYSYEENNVFKYIMSKIIENSFFTGISSPGFKEFLPQSEKYKLVHNISEVSRLSSFKKKETGVINLVWIGAMRYFDHQIKIIEHLANDERFMMYYHGDGPEYQKYIEYFNEKPISNLVFTGSYNNKEKASLLEKADILNNSYKIKNMMKVKYALSNKFYDGIIYGIPQLVESDTFKSKMVEENDLGFSIDLEADKFPEMLLEKYKLLSSIGFNKKTEPMLEKINEDNRKYRKFINEFLEK